jgi:RimJ/RimL family protein N-acetyltransferase
MSPASRCRTAALTRSWIVGSLLDMASTLVGWRGRPRRFVGVDTGRRLQRPDAPLSDGVVSVRPVDGRDRSMLSAASDDSDIVASFGQSPAPDLEVEFFGRRWDEGVAGGFAICGPEGEAVGMVMLEVRPQGHADIGYWLLPEARGSGYATRATRLVATWALLDQGFPRVQLWAAAGNLASQRVAVLSGFKHEGRLRRHGLLPSGERVDAHYYSLIPEDLEA